MENTKDNKSVILSVRIDAVLKEKLSLAASKENITESKFIRKAILNQINEEFMNKISISTVIQDKEDDRVKKYKEQKSELLSSLAILITLEINKPYTEILKELKEILDLIEMENPILNFNDRFEFEDLMNNFIVFISKKFGLTTLMIVLIKMLLMSYLVWSFKSLFTTSEFSVSLIDDFKELNKKLITNFSDEI